MITQQARDVHFSSIVVDAHSDDIGWVVDRGEELAEDTDGRQVTFPKMRQGGVTAQWSTSGGGSSALALGDHRSRLENTMS